MISIGSARASASAQAVLPLAVGPISSRAGGREDVASVTVRVFMAGAADYPLSGGEGAGAGEAICARS